MSGSAATVVPAVRASMAIPGLFTPKTINGRTLEDYFPRAVDQRTVVMLPSGLHLLGAAMMIDREHDGAADTSS